MGAKEDKEEEKQEGFNIDEALDKLEEINTKLAGGELSLDESINLYKEGVVLADKCKEQLEGVEKELEVINR